MEWSLTKILGTAGGAAIIIGSFLSYIIGEYFKQKKTLESLKDNSRNKAIRNLVQNVRELKGSIKSLDDDLGEYSKTVAYNTAKLEGFSTRLHDVMLRFENMEDRLKTSVKEEVKSQIHHITDELIRVKERRKKNGTG